MGYILYYSTFCVQCQKLLQYISKSTVSKKIHFICIDARTVDAAGNMVVHLENGHDLVVPPNITRVPALIIITQNNRVVFGCEEIKRALEMNGAAPAAASVGGGGGVAASTTHASAAAAAAGEPRPYVLNSCVGCGSSGFGVTSDSYSYYDMTPEELRLSGTGGTRQMHNYVSVKQPHDSSIYTPTDDYRPDKVGDVSLEKLQQQRNAEIGAGTGPVPVAGGRP